TSARRMSRARHPKGLSASGTRCLAGPSGLPKKALRSRSIYLPAVDMRGGPAEELAEHGEDSRTRKVNEKVRQKRYQEPTVRRQILVADTFCPGLAPHRPSGWPTNSVSVAGVARQRRAARSRPLPRA